MFRQKVFILRGFITKKYKIVTSSYTVTCIYLGVSCSILNILLNHISALVLKSFSFIVFIVINRICLLM
jgi:hypothetical protein